VRADSQDEGRERARADDWSRGLEGFWLYDEVAAAGMGLGETGQAKVARVLCGLLEEVEEDEELQRTRRKRRRVGRGGGEEGVAAPP